MKPRLILLIACGIILSVSSAQERPSSSPTTQNDPDTFSGAVLSAQLPSTPTSSVTLPAIADAATAELQRVHRPTNLVKQTKTGHFDFVSGWASGKGNYGRQTYQIDPGMEYCNHRVEVTSARGTQSHLVWNNQHGGGVYDYSAEMLDERTLEFRVGTKGTGNPGTERTWIEGNLIIEAVTQYTDERDRKAWGCRWPLKARPRDMCVCGGLGSDAGLATQYDCYGKPYREAQFCEIMIKYSYQVCLNKSESCDASRCTIAEQIYRRSDAPMCEAPTMNTQFTPPAECKKLMDTVDSLKIKYYAATEKLSADQHACYGHDEPTSLSFRGGPHKVNCVEVRKNWGSLASDAKAVQDELRKQIYAVQMQGKSLGDDCRP